MTERERGKGQVGKTESQESLLGAHARELGIGRDQVQSGVAARES